MIERSYIVRVLNVGLAYIIIFLYVIHVFRPYTVYYYYDSLEKMFFFIFLVLIPALFLTFTSILSKSMNVNMVMTTVGIVFIIVSLSLLTAQLGFITI